MLFDDFFKGKKVLITGNTGFKGAWLSLYLRHLGAHVSGFSDQDVPEMSLHAICRHADWLDQHVGDISDYGQISTVIGKVNPDMVFHLAAQAYTLSGYEDPMGTFRTNAMGTVNVLEALRNHGSPCLAVIVTSDKCYRNNEWVWGYREIDTLAGIDPYSASKSVAEIITHSYYKSFFADDGPVRLCTCRAGNVLGGGDWSRNRIIPDCVRSWSNGSPVEIRNPQATRPWNYVLDVLTGYLKAARQLEAGNINGEAFNFGPGMDAEVSVQELVGILWDFWDRRDFVPYLIKQEKQSFFEHTYLRLNSDKARLMLQWQPLYDIREGLKVSADWYRVFASDAGKISTHTERQLHSYLEKLG